MLLRAFIVAVLFTCAAQARAQPLSAAYPGGRENTDFVRLIETDAADEVENATVFFDLEGELRVHTEPDGRRSRRIRLNIRDAVRVLSEKDGWSHIEWHNRRGYVRTSALSGLRIPLEESSAPVFYVVNREVRIHTEPNGPRSARIPLNIRDAVRVLSEEDGWSHVKWNERRGYVESSALSNLWIRIDKSDRLVYVYEGTELIRTFPADVSVSDEDKVRLSGRDEQDHWRIPEGVFFIARKNANSRYFRALVISYPNQVHAARGLQDGLISRAQYDAIFRAELAFVEPPMGTPLGGLIEIHGNGSGRQRAWTRGCVAIRNVHMSELWDMVHVGTPVIIER